MMREDRRSRASRIASSRGRSSDSVSDEQAAATGADVKFDQPWRDPLKDLSALAAAHELDLVTCTDVSDILAFQLPGGGVVTTPPCDDPSDRVPLQVPDVPESRNAQWLRRG